MKRIFLLTALTVITAGAVSAQVDIKAGPIGLVFKGFNTGLEVGVAPNVGIEVTAGYDWKKVPLLSEENLKGRVLKLGVNGRYYFNPSEKKLDGFYAGVYSRYAGGNYDFYNPKTEAPDSFKGTKAAIGFLLGGKIVSKNNRIVFDLGFGLGRNLVHKYINKSSTVTADVSGIPFINVDMPVNLKIGYRFGGGSRDRY